VTKQKINQEEQQMQAAAGDPRRLDLEEILSAAREASGLSDIGEPDILPGLRVLLDAFVSEAKLSAAGIEAQRATLIGHAANRMRIEDLFKRHPEILEQEIKAPIIIVGLPRSGTTKLQRMMAANTDLQSLPLWKILNPAPLGPTLPGGEDPRIAIAEQVEGAMRQYYPDFYAGHPMNAREPDEEVFMADQVLRGWTPCYAARVPSYEAWLRQQDFGVWYDYLKRLLQLFQWQDATSGKRWLLKTCEHLPYMNDLFKVFPDTTIVHCHRDPVTTTASLAALITAYTRMNSDVGTGEEAGRFTLSHLSKQMGGYMQQRPLLEKQHRFVDVSYADIVNDITSAIERIHAAADMPLSDAARAAMLRWETSNPAGKHGQHKYSLASLGLAEGDIRNGFAGYLQRFGTLCAATG